MSMHYKCRFFSLFSFSLFSFPIGRGKNWRKAFGIKRVRHFRNVSPMLYNRSREKTAREETCNLRVGDVGKAVSSRQTTKAKHISNWRRLFVEECEQCLIVKFPCEVFQVQRVADRHALLTYMNGNVSELGKSKRSYQHHELWTRKKWRLEPNLPS